MEVPPVHKVCPNFIMHLRHPVRRGWYAMNSVRYLEMRKSLWHGFCKRVSTTTSLERTISLELPAESGCGSIIMAGQIQKKALTNSRRPLSIADFQVLVEEKGVGRAVTLEQTASPELHQLHNGFWGDAFVNYADIVRGGESMTLVVRIFGGRRFAIEDPMLIFTNT